MPAVPQDQRAWTISGRLGQVRHFYTISAFIDHLCGKLLVLNVEMARLTILLDILKVAALPCMLKAAGR